MTAPLLVTPLAQIEPHAVEWLWDHRLPYGELSLLAGVEGVGKSTFLAWVAAQVTRGTLPGKLAGTPAGVLIAALEDDAASTLVPRMMAAGADLNRVATVGDADGTLSLPQRMVAIEAAVAAGIDGEPVRLLILDPIKSTTGSMDTDRENGVRAVLAPLVKLAQARGVAVIASAHFKKGAGGEDVAAWKVSGSPAWTQVPRSVLFFGPDPDGDGDGDESARIIAHAKCNVGRTMLTLGARIVTATVESAAGSPIETSRMTLGGESAVRASDMNQPREAGVQAGGAVAFLRTYLGDGERHASEDVKAAAEAEGISLSTLDRARRAAGVETARVGAGKAHRSFYWLPAGGVCDVSGGSEAPSGASTPVSDDVSANRWCESTDGVTTPVTTAPTPTMTPAASGQASLLTPVTHVTPVRAVLA